MQSVREINFDAGATVINGRWCCCLVVVFVGVEHTSRLAPDGDVDDLERSEFDGDTERLWQSFNHSSGVISEFVDDEPFSLR